MKAPAEGVLRVGGGNVYVGNKEPGKAVGVATATRFHSWGWSEGANLPRHLEGRRGYDPLISFGSDDPRDANDCVMQVRKSLDVVHFSMTQACEDVEGSKIGHQRTFSMLAYKAPMLGARAVVCHVAIHPNAIAPFDTAAAAPKVVGEYVKSVGVLRDMLAFAKAMGWLIVVSGDFNSRKDDDKSFPTVYDVFKEFKLAVKTEGIDGMAWDRRLTLVHWERIPKSKTGSDHPFWTVADLARRAKKTAA